MPNIDFSLMVTQDDILIEQLMDHAQACKDECRKRIFDVVDATAQINLAAAAGAGILSEAELALYQSGLVWIHAMRMFSRNIPVDQDPSLLAWPPLPEGVQHFANQF